MPATVYSSLIIFVLIASLAMLVASTAFYVVTDVLKLRDTAKRLAEHASVRLRAVAVVYDGKLGVAVRNIGSRTVTINRIIVLDPLGFVAAEYSPDTRVEPGQLYFNPVLGYIAPSDYVVFIETDTGDVFSTRAINLDLSWSMDEYRLYNLYPSQVELDVPLMYTRLYNYESSSFGITTSFYGGVFGFVILDVNGTGDAYSWGYMSLLDYYGGTPRIHNDIRYSGSGATLSGSFDAYTLYNTGDNRVAPDGNYTVETSLDLYVYSGTKVRLYTCVGFYWLTIPNGFTELDFSANSSSYMASGPGYYFREWITSFIAGDVNDVWNLAKVLEEGSTDVSDLPGKPLTLGVARCIDYVVDMRYLGITLLHVSIENGTVLDLPGGDRAEVFPYVTLPGANKAYTSAGTVDVYIYPRVDIFFNPEALAISILESV